jgi:hypothetical protein
MMPIHPPNRPRLTGVDEEQAGTKIPNGPFRVYETAYLGDVGSDQASQKIMSGQIEAGSLVDGRPKEINNSSTFE